MAGTALAKWDHDTGNHGATPPGTLRPEISLRQSGNDGRADLHQSATAADRYDHTVTKPAPDRDYGQAKHGPPVSLKADIALRMQNGDSREGSTAMSKQATVSERGAPDNSYGREHRPPPVALKQEIQQKMQHGDNREGGNASRSPAARPSDSAARHGDGKQDKGLARPLSGEEKLAICKHTGVCLPILMATDNSDDKSE